MYSFIFTSKTLLDSNDNYLLHILFDGLIVDSIFVQFPKGSSQDELDVFANSVIDGLEGIQ